MEEWCCSWVGERARVVEGWLRRVVGCLADWVGVWGCLESGSVLPSSKLSTVTLTIRQLIQILFSVTCFSHIEGLGHRALIDSNQQHGEDERTENGKSHEEANEAEKR